MLVQSMPLTITANALRHGQLDPLDYVRQVCGRVEEFDLQIQSLLPEPDRAARLHQQALDLQSRFPEPEKRPPLYGVLVGVKDIFRVDGFPTRAGSRLPPEALKGSEAKSVSILKGMGALILGKTVTAEFAYFEPGPTRNPHNLAHTPGGSSSGSAAAVAAGFCPVAFGTQTIGSVIRPAAYCGIIGFKPSYGRISRDGVVPLSESLDHIGLFTSELAGMALVASLLCQGWRSLPDTTSADPLPVLGVPEGAYLKQTSAEGLEAFEAHIALLEKAGYTVRHISALEDIDNIAQHTFQLMAIEAAEVHAAWFAKFEAQYGTQITQLIRKGQATQPGDKLDCQALQRKVRADLETSMKAAQIDLWITPAATGPAPEGIASTGSPAMNLPWTLAGFPTITLPAGKSRSQLPLGVQCSGAFGTDEELMRWSKGIVEALGQ